MLSKLFHIPFYQTHWHNILLEDIFKNYVQNDAGKDNAELYNLFYAKLNQQELNLDPEFVMHRQQVSIWLEKVMKDLGITSHATILSIGSGFGLIEEPLIKKGYNITLQECHDKLIDYWKKRIPSDKLKFINSQDLSDIDANSFDFVYAHGVCYSMTPKILESFFHQVKRILKPGRWMVQSI